MKTAKMNYRGYEGCAEFDEDSGEYVGEILDIKEKIVYTGSDYTELVSNFISAVDDYCVTWEVVNAF